MTAIINNNLEIPSCGICLEDLLPCENTSPCRNKLISHIFHRHCAEGLAATIQKDHTVKCPICRKYKLAGIVGSNTNNTNVTVVRRERPGARFPGEGSFIVIDLPQWELPNDPERNPLTNRGQVYRHRSPMGDILERRSERNRNGVVGRAYTLGLQMIDATLDLLIEIARRYLGV